MKTLKYMLLLLLLTSAPAIAADGVITVSSPYTVSETAERLEGVLVKKGMNIFKRVNHTEGAKNVGLEMRDTELFIFGNPKVGTPLMNCQQTVAIDLPQKALIWKDAHEKVWVSYNDPKYIEKRHAVSGCNEVIEKIQKALSGIVKEVITE